MSTLALPQVDTSRAAGPRKKRVSPWKTWGLLLLLPYVVIFVVFVVYPVGYGLWLARHPQSYVQLFDDPIFAGSVVNTLVFLIVAINLKMIVALFLSGFFVTARPGSSGCRCSSSCRGRCRRFRRSCRSASC